MHRTMHGTNIILQEKKIVIRSEEKERKMKESELRDNFCLIFGVHNNSEIRLSIF